MAVDKPDPQASTDYYETSVPDPQGRCSICGSDLHDASHHTGIAAVGPAGQERCEVPGCGSDLHTTQKHPGV